MKVDLNVVKEALNQATEGEWVGDGFGSITIKGSGKFVATVYDHDDAFLVSKAPQWLASLVEQVEQMKQQYADEINKKGNELDRAYFQGLKLRIQVEGMQSLINHIEQITSDGLTRNEIMNYKRLKGASHDPK